MDDTIFPRDFIHQLTQMRAGEHLDVPGFEGVRCRLDLDGRVFLLEPVGSGIKETFLFHKANGKIYLGADYVVSAVSIQ